MFAATNGFDRLRLRTNNPLAARLYENLGFQRCKGDPSATHEREL
jgi:hypothetical protein